MTMLADRRPSRPDAFEQRTLHQRLDALLRANEIRTYRAELKKDLKTGRVTVLGLLAAEQLDERLVTMKVFELLLAAPKYGRVKADQLLRRCRISPSKSLGGLSPRQRAELVRMLRDRDARPSLFDDPLAAPLAPRTQPPAVAGGVRSRTAASGDDRA